MAKDRHKNYKKASNIIFLTVVLGFIKLIFIQKEGVLGESSDKVVETLAMFTLFTLLFIFVLGLLVRFGLSFVKFILPILPFFGLFSIPGAFLLFAQQPITGIITIVVFGLEIWAIVLLFKIPKEASNSNPPSPESVPPQ